MKRGLRFILLSLLLIAAPGNGAPEAMAFWSSVRRGTNLFDDREQPARLRAAAEFGVSFVRLAPSKWLYGRTARELGDFLIGPVAGPFRGIPPRDLARLIEVLDQAHHEKLKVVLTLLSLPGARWSQHHGGIEERRLWTDGSVQQEAIAFWVELARGLRGHPALVGYNLRNEPSPELVEPRLKDWHRGDYRQWYERVRGTPADLNRFYRNAVKAIRAEDRKTPIVLDSGYYATPWAFEVLEPVDDPNTLYSFHMYEPYAFTNHKNAGRYRYPGHIPIGEGETPQIQAWDEAALAAFLQPVVRWQERHRIPSSRILVGEFGVYRTNSGAQQYLADLIHIFERHGWHWAFYSFREDSWMGMDYELGNRPAPAAYWKAIELGRVPGPDVYRPNAMSDLLRSALKAAP